MGFSEDLQKFMKTNSISMMDLSVETDIDRTVIYRYVKGTRIPSDVNIVIRIADALQMSVSEKKHLLKEYDKLILGEPMVYSYQYVQNLLHSLNQPNDNFNIVESQWQIKRKLKKNNELIELKSKEEIVTYIIELLRYIAEAESNTEKLFLVMQPTYEEVQRFLPHILKKKNIEVEQIVCMEQNVNQSYKNLDLFYGVLPMCFSYAKYEVYYYYDVLKNHINNTTYFPNMLLIQDFVVQFDYKMRYGIAVQNSVYAATARKYYDLLRKESRNLMARGKSPEAIGDFLVYWSANNSGVFFEQLYAGFCMDRQILENCVSSVPEKEELINSLLKSKGEWKGEEYITFNQMPINLISYGSRKGMEDFINTGCIKELPATLCRPLNCEERGLVLERMIILAQEKRIRYRLLADKFDLPDGIRFCWDESKKRIVLSRITEKEIFQVVIEEQSIYKTFRMYLKYMEKKNLVYGEKESLKYLTKLYKNFGDGLYL